MADPEGLRDKIAIALHDADCGDRKCDRATMSAYYAQADVALAAALPALTARGAAEEREACAQLCDEYAAQVRYANYGAVVAKALREFADLIRARTPKETTP